jgi:hypothetical protein
MDWLNTAVAVLALGISVLAFLRTLFLDQVVADLVFEWDATLGVVVGKLVVLSGTRSTSQAFALRNLRGRTSLSGWLGAACMT